VITAALDMDTIAKQRRAWGVFRDRRTDIYHDLIQPTPARLMPAA
jgi:predicted amidohydrolase